MDDRSLRKNDLECGTYCFVPPVNFVVIIIGKNERGLYMLLFTFHPKLGCKGCGLAYKCKDRGFMHAILVTNINQKIFVNHDVNPKIIFMFRGISTGKKLSSKTKRFLISLYFMYTLGAGYFG